MRLIKWYFEEPQMRSNEETQKSLQKLLLGRKTSDFLRHRPVPKHLDSDYHVPRVTITYTYIQKYQNW